MTRSTLADRQREMRERLLTAPRNGTPKPEALSSAMEQHFTPAEIGKLWGVSAPTVVRWFQDEPGVLRLEGRGRGSRKHMRIPLSVMERVHARLVSK